MELFIKTLSELAVSVAITGMFIAFLYYGLERVLAPIFKEYIIAKFDNVKESIDKTNEHFDITHKVHTHIEDHLKAQDVILDNTLSTVLKIDDRTKIAEKRIENHEDRIVILEDTVIKGEKK